VPEEEERAMKRGFGLVATVGAVVGIIVSLALVVGVWIGRGAVNERVGLIVGAIDTHVERAASTLDELTIRIDGLHSRVQQLQARAERLAQDGALDGQAVDALATAIERELGDDLQRLRETYVALRERVEAGVDSVQRARRFLPFIPLPDMPTDLLQGFDQRMQELDASLQELRATLDAREGPINEIASRVAGRLGQLDERIGALSALVGSLQSRLAEIRSTLQAAEATARYWVTVVTVVLTVLFVYGGLLHLSLFAHGRAWMRTPREPIQTPA
jgi:uncharacterized protein YoxC